jgi:hypothetical protein
MNVRVKRGLRASKEVYKDKMKRKFQKRRKKRYRKIWGNCVPLNGYKDKMILKPKLVQERRKARYEEEKCLYEMYVVSQKKKDEKFQIIIKDKSNSQAKLSH